MREIITGTLSPAIFDYGVLFSGLDCGLNFTVKTVVKFN